MARKRSKRIQGKNGGSKAFEFNPDYTDIKRDLAQIAILAASFFVILIVLSFILK